MSADPPDIGDPRAREVLDFWFGELKDGFADDQHRRQWFNGGAEFDDRIRTRFSALMDTAADGDLESWLDDPHSRLAYILVNDQLPRNLYRGEARAFARDGAALNAAKTGIDSGMDQALGPDERCFFYLPFEHSECLVDQHTCVGLFSALVENTPDPLKRIVDDYRNFARQHRDILQRFGRFPHRNKVLGRGSTPDEADYLKSGRTFGQ